MDLPTTNQRALDAFLGPATAQGGTAIGGATSSDAPGTSGLTYLEPADTEQHRQWGFTVLTDDSGRAYLPPQGGYEIGIQPPPLSVLPGSGHSGPSTAPPSAAKPDQSPTSSGSAAPSNEVNQTDDVKSPSESPPIESPLGKAVDDLLNLSPTLRAKWAAAQKAGWEIEIISDDRRSHANGNTQRIYINLKDITPGGDQALKGARLLAHEMGHAVTEFVPIQPAETKVDFVRGNTQLALEHEGAAAFENARARDEIRTNGGPDIEIRGGFDDEYTGIYEQYKWGGISEAEAKARMTAVQAREPEESGTRSTTRAEAFAETFGNM